MHKDYVTVTEDPEEHTGGLDMRREHQWFEYSNRVRGRLDVGAREYGEVSFRRPLPELIREIEEELMDVSGWAFVLWARLQEIRRCCKELPQAEAA